MQNSLAMSRSKENSANDIGNVSSTRQGVSTEMFASTEGEEVVVKTENYNEERMDLKTEYASDGRGRRKVVQEPRDEDGCHGDSGLLNMLAEVASATLHNDTLARRTTRNPRGRPRKQCVAEVPLNSASESIEASDSNKLNLAQIQLLTEKQLVDLFAVMDSDEIRRTFSYSCRLLQRCQFTANSFGSEMKARQEMQKHLSQHVRDLMRKARESPDFRFSAAPVVSKAKKLPTSAATSSTVRETRTPPASKVKDKIKIKLTPASTNSSRKASATPKTNSRQATPKRKVAEMPVSKVNSASKMVRSKIKEEPVARKEVTTKRKRGATVAAPVTAPDEDQLGPETDAPNSEETTVKDKWLKLYHEKFRAADEARFRAIQAELSADSDGDHEYSAVAEEVIVTSEETVSTAAAGSSGNSLPDHDYNIYRFSKKSSAGTVAPLEVRNQDEQMEAVAQSVAAAAQEKEKLKRKRTQQTSSGVPLHSFMLEETTKQSKVVVKNKPTEPLPCVGSEVVVGYNPNEFYLMKSADLPVIEDLRQKSATPSSVAVNSTTASSSSGSGTQQFMFVCMTEDGELIEETVQEQEMYLEDEEQLLEQVAAQATVRHVPEKDMVDIARKRAKIKPKFVSQSAAERELALQYISELKQQRGSGVDSLHCKICTPVRTFTAPTTLLSHYRSHAGIKPYECRRCGAVFTRQHSLNYHMLIHANLSRFTCPDCHRQFRHPSHYKEHRRRHTGEAPYECSDCMQRFRTRNSYKRHLMTRHGKLLTSTGGLIILPEEEFNKVRCKPRPMRSGRPVDAAAASATAVSKSYKEASASGSTSSATATPNKSSTKSSKNKAAAAATGTDPDGTGNFEQQRQEDLIRLLYQRLTSPNEHSSAESGSGSSRSNSPVPVLMPSELDDETQVVEQVVVESPEVAAAVVVESIPSSQEVVEEQCEVVTDEAWGSSYISLTVDGQNNVIFLDESQAAEAAVTTGASVVIEESKPVSTVERKSGKSTRGRSAASVATAIPAASSSSNESNVDLLSFVHNAGVMVQHILDIQSDNSTP